MDTSSIEHTFSRVLEPFTRKRKPAPSERASMLTLWSALVRRAATRRIVFVAQEAKDTAHLLLAKSANPSSATSPSSPLFRSRHHERLLVLVQFLRFATLRKVIDNVLLDRSGCLLTLTERGTVVRSMLHAAAEICHVLPSEDRRVVGQRRGLPWGSLQDDMDSSDEDRDDGAPRPVDDVFRSVGEVLAAQWTLVAPPVATASFQEVGRFAEEVKLMLLRTLKYRDTNAAGTMLALTVLLLRYVLQWHRAHPVATTAAVLPAVPDAMLEDTLVRELYGSLDRYAETYAAQSDGAFLQQWGKELHLLPAVRVMHSMLLVYGMHLGMYIPTISSVNRTRAHQGVAFSEQARCASLDPLAFSSSPFERSARRCTLEVIMECLEWSLANSGPACTSMYLHRYPSRYGELSGHFRSTTEMRVVGEASVYSDEITHRCEVLCEEIQARWELSQQVVTGDIPAYPHIAAGLPPGMTTSGPFAIRYETRKKISAFLNDICPSRYPIRELLVLPSECPDIEALLAEREWIALAQTEVLRGIRLEVHHRLEWERVEAHERAAIAEASRQQAAATFQASQQSILADAANERGWLMLDVDEATGRLRLLHEWLRTAVAVEGKQVVQRVRARVQERTTWDVSTAWNIVSNLESAKRATIHDDYHLAVRAALFQAETSLRHAIRLGAQHSSNQTLSRAYVALQCAGSAARVREQEVAERSLVVRYGMGLMSRGLMRSNRRDAPDGSVAASFLQKILNPLLVERCQSAFEACYACGCNDGVTNAETTTTTPSAPREGVALVDVVRWYNDALGALRTIETHADCGREAVEVQWLHECANVLDPCFDAHRRTSVVLAEAAARRMVLWRYQVAVIECDEAWARLQLEACAELSAASDLLGTSTCEALAVYASITQRVAALLSDGEPKRRKALAAAECDAWHVLCSRRRGDLRQHWNRHQASASRCLGPQQGVTPRLAQEVALASLALKPSRPPSPTAEFIPLIGDEEELDRKSRSTSSITLQAKSPSRASSGGLTTMMGTLSTDSRVLSRPHSNLDDMVSSIAYVMDLGSPWWTGEWGAASRRMHSPQRQQVLSPHQHTQQDRSVVVVEVPKRPSSGKPAVYRTVHRHTVEFL